MSVVACSRPCVITAEVSSVQEAVEHPDANFMELAAVPMTELFTRYTYNYVFYSGGSKIEQDQEHWVVPLVNPGSTVADDGIVYAWALASGPQQPASDPHPWIDRASETFDGTPKRLRVAARVSFYVRRRAGLLEPIREAERVHGLTSHPDAPVFFVK